MGSPGCDFPYVPVPTCAPDDDTEGTDLVVATATFVAPESIARALKATCGETATQTLLDQEPIFWTRVRAAKGFARDEVAAALKRANVPIRYVASARRQSMQLPPPLDFRGATSLRPTDWRAAQPQAPPVDPDSDGRWFLRGAPGGLAVDRHSCGTGRRTRLAVIDDDAADFGQLDLESTILVGIDRPSSASGHGALIIGWAVGARTYEGPRFSGVAPDASVRAYLVPRPGDDAASLPLAIALAAADGADVIVCATWVEGTTSPMLDDALDLAIFLGRRGRGCAVVFPTGRETSRPKGSIHASLSLSLGDPASDPRVFCVAPGGREGGWFLWREQHGRLRPFANRGPAVRLLAPGDDIAYPFLAKERFFHAESSGAAALAAGVLLLVISSNPSLHLSDIFALLVRCAAVPAPLLPETLDALADPADALPLRRDRDGHDAKHGYGRLHAGRACTAAGDPVALELISMGEDAAAIAWCDAKRFDPRARSAYTATLAHWAVRVLLADAMAEHDLRVILRHLRLVAMQPRRAAAHAPGAIARHVALLLRSFAREGGSAHAPRPVREELERMEWTVRAATASARSTEADLESTVLDLSKGVFADTCLQERARASRGEATHMSAQRPPREGSL